MRPIAPSQNRSRTSVPPERQTRIKTICGRRCHLFNILRRSVSVLRGFGRRDWQKPLQASWSGGCAQQRPIPSVQCRGEIRLGVSSWRSLTRRFLIVSVKVSLAERARQKPQPSANCGCLLFIAQRFGAATILPQCCQMPFKTGYFGYRLAGQSPKFNEAGRNNARLGGDSYPACDLSFLAILGYFKVSMLSYRGLEATIWSSSGLWLY